MPPSSSASTAHSAVLSAHFGSRLKHWRRTQKHTQAELARELGVDGSYISKLESSQRPPTTDIARRCDEILTTGGELSGLLALMESDRSTEVVSAATPMANWPPFHPAVPPSPTPLTHRRPAASIHTAGTLARLLAAYTEIDCSMGGHQISASVEQQAQDVIGMHVTAETAMTADLLTLAAKFARLAAWIRFDALDHNGSRFWHDCGRRWALAAGNTALAAELLARQSIVQSALGDPAGGIVLAAAVAPAGQDSPVSAQIWAMLAEARGRALRGEAGITADLLSHAESLMSDMDEKVMASPAPFRNTFVWHSIAGKCHLDLIAAGVAPHHHAREALRLLGIAVSEASPHHLRDLAVLQLRLARVHHYRADPLSARAALAEADSLADRCGSARLQAGISSMSEVLGLSDDNQIIPD